MKKLMALIGGLIAISVMEQPKRVEPRIVNNYFITKTGCNGKCNCGKH